MVESRAWLEQRVAELATQYGDEEPPLPDGWGGFVVMPRAIEFWQHHKEQHDRLLYTRDGGGWLIERLAP